MSLCLVGRGTIPSSLGASEIVFSDPSLIITQLRTWAGLFANFWSSLCSSLILCPMNSALASLASYFSLLNLGKSGLGSPSSLRPGRSWGDTKTLCRVPGLGSCLSGITVLCAMKSKVLKSIVSFISFRVCSYFRWRSRVCSLARSITFSLSHLWPGGNHSNWLCPFDIDPVMFDLFLLSALLRCPEPRIK